MFHLCGDIGEGFSYLTCNDLGCLEDEGKGLVGYRGWRGLEILLSKEQTEA